MCIRDSVEVDPGSVLCRKHSLSTKDHAILFRSGKALQHFLKPFSCKLLNSLTSPAGKYFIRMVMVMIVMMVLIMAAAGTIFTMVMMMVSMFFLMIVLMVFLVLMFFMIVMVFMLFF